MAMLNNQMVNDGFHGVSSIDIPNFSPKRSGFTIVISIQVAIWGIP